MLKIQDSLFLFYAFQLWVKDLYFHLTCKICENGSPSLQRSKKDYTQTQLLNAWFLSGSSYILIPNFLQRCQIVFSDTTEKHQDSDSKVPEPFMFILHIELVPWVQWSLRVEIFSVPHQISSFHRLLAKQNILFPLYFFYNIFKFNFIYLSFSYTKHPNCILPTSSQPHFSIPMATLFSLRKEQISW